MGNGPEPYTPPPHEEYQYLDLVRHILDHGKIRSDRTNTGTISIFGAHMRFSLRNNLFPLLTTKKVFFRGVAEELFWFLRGSTNANELTERNIHIWEGNSTREYLDSIGLTDRKVGDLGPVYGFQWRHFGAKYVDMETDYTGQGIDQLSNVIELIKHHPTDRRIIMIAWNPTDLAEMALPPCPTLMQFYVDAGELSCQVYSRSGDMGCGVPFNIASYSLLTILVSHLTGLQPGELVFTLGDAHVYSTHVEALELQLSREPRPFPTLEITRPISEPTEVSWTDLKLTGYQPHDIINLPMAI